MRMRMRMRTRKLGLILACGRIAQRKRIFSFPVGSEFGVFGMRFQGGLKAVAVHLLARTSPSVKSLKPLSSPSLSLPTAQPSEARRRRKTKLMPNEAGYIFLIPVILRNKVSVLGMAWT